MCADGSSVCAKTMAIEERLSGTAIFAVPEVLLTAGGGAVSVFDFARRVVFLRPAFSVLGAGATGDGAVAGECAASVLILIASE